MSPLLLFLPILFLGLGALGIIILQQSRPSIGYSWLIAAASGILVTGALLALRFFLPIEVVIEQWRPFGEISSPPVFRLSQNTWPYAFSLAVLALAAILTDSARLNVETHPLRWSIGLSLTAFGLLAVMAGNPLTLVVTWTVVDLVELLIVMSSDAGRKMGQQTVTAFSVRVSGQIIVILAILYARSLAIPFTFNPIPGPVAIFMLLAVGLRLGVLPLNIPYVREVYPSRGLGNIARMIGPASSLVVLARMPAPVASQTLQPWLFGLTALAALYGSAMWMTASSELNGRPYWSTALAALAIASVLHNNPAASIAWGVALLLSGSVIFLFSAHRRKNPTLPLIALFGLIGLPFTPVAGGWVGATDGNLNSLTLIYLSAIVFLIWGYLRFTFQQRDELHHMERWVHAVYPTGLILLILAHWTVGFFGYPGSRSPGVWWASVVVLLVAGSGAGLAFTRRGLRIVGADSFLAAFVRRVGSGLGAVLRLNWIYGTLVWTYKVVQSVIQLLTEVFEGDGGILWSLVMLTLLISLVWVGGGAP